MTNWTRPADISIEPADDYCRRFVEIAAAQPSIALSGIAADSLRASLPTSVRVLGPEYCSPRADLIAQLGEQQALSGEFTDHWTLEPFYLRRSAAEEKATTTLS